METTLWGCL
jgi:hypothetical protein